MDSLQHRLIFALNILKENDKASRLILSDLLESEGEIALANFARTKKKSWHKRLDSVVSILPYLMTLQITCDFVAKSLISLPKTRGTGYVGTINAEDIRPLARAIQNVAQWAQSGKRAESILTQSLQKIRSVSEWDYGTFYVFEVMQSLNSAISTAVQAMTEEVGHREFVHASRADCRKAIKMARAMTKRHPKANFNMKELREWQTSHAIEVLENALNDV